MPSSTLDLPKLFLLGISLHWADDGLDTDSGEAKAADPASPSGNHIIHRAALLA